MGRPAAGVGVMACCGRRLWSRGRGQRQRGGQRGRQRRGGLPVEEAHPGQQVLHGDLVGPVLDALRAERVPFDAEAAERGVEGEGADVRLRPKEVV